MAAIVLTCSGAGLLSPKPAWAYDPLEFVPDQVAAARLYGSAVMRRYGRPAYGIKLFVDLGTFSADDLSRESFALDLEYKSALSGAEIASAFTGQMADEGIATGAQIRAWHKQLAQFLPSVQASQHLTAVFHPREGTRFFLNGNPVGLIAGNDFCRAFFGIWLDSTTTMPDLRARLLKGAG
ncbi:chalcone isomerase family protein [Robbsia sp. KACC 23696]|uniref:chalcone isomerase family protein n=1 Tax=Robbsia sp. KACC 23696 TaxID=3149231 RepID=UPI00325A9761